MLTLGSNIRMEIMLSQISLHCKNFVSLKVKRKPTIGNEKASAIVTFLPNLKYLVMKKASIERESLVMILRGCKKLVHFDVSNCIGFKVDEEMLKLASHITKFEYKVSRERSLRDYYDDYYYHDALAHDVYRDRVQG